eukprot:Lankesteria_metandrocarpae@DN6214_c0_g1_i1.p1
MRVTNHQHSSDLLIEPHQSSIRYKRKRRVRRMEPRRFDLDPMSSLPVGFVATGNDHTGAGMQLIGLDWSEVLRRYGTNKTFQQNLHGYEERLRGCRDYFVVLDEEKSTATVLAGSCCSLFFHKSAAENHKRMQWHNFWERSLYNRGLMGGSLLRKYHRYRQFVGEQDSYIWQDSLEDYQKLQSRISETQPIHTAKGIKGRTSGILAKRKLLLNTNCKLFHHDSTAVHTDKLTDWTPGFRTTDEIGKSNLYRDETTGTDSKNLRNRMSEQLLELLEKPDVAGGSTGTYNGGTSEVALQRLVEEVKSRAESNFKNLNCNRLLPFDFVAGVRTAGNKHKRGFQVDREQSRLQMLCAPWSWSWSSSVVKSRINSEFCTDAMHHYGMVYPAFAKQYNFARKRLTEKAKYEAEYTRARKTNVAKTVGEGGQSSSNTLAVQQVQDALSIIDERTIRSTQFENTTNSSTTDAHQLQLNFMRSRLPAFDLDAKVPGGIYKVDDVMRSSVRHDTELTPIPAKEYILSPSPAQTALTASWSKAAVQLLDIMSVVTANSTVKPTDTQIAQNAVDIKLLNWLILLFPSHHQNIRNAHQLLGKLAGCGMIDCTSNFAKWVLEDFYRQDETKVYFMPQESVSRYMVTILWLCVALSGKWTFDFHRLLNEDWRGKYNSQFTACSELMGLKRNNASSGANVYSLCAPLEVRTTSQSALSQSSAMVFFGEEQARAGGRGGGRGRGRGRGRGQ